MRRRQKPHARRLLSAGDARVGARLSLIRDHRNAPKPRTSRDGGCPSSTPTTGRDVVSSSSHGPSATKPAPGDHGASVSPKTPPRRTCSSKPPPAPSGSSPPATATPSTGSNSRTASFSSDPNLPGRPTHRAPERRRRAPQQHRCAAGAGPYRPNGPVRAHAHRQVAQRCQGHTTGGSHPRHHVRLHDDLPDPDEWLLRRRARPGSFQFIGGHQARILVLDDVAAAARPHGAPPARPDHPTRSVGWAWPCPVGVA